MLEKIAEWICRFIFLPHIARVERKIGYKLVFHDIPSRFINGIVPWDMTGIWRRFEIKVEAGVNYWTMGNVVKGMSSRYDRNAPEYQTWVGGYNVKLLPGNLWTPEDHANLAIADQNSWLKTYGDPHPTTSFAGEKYTAMGTIMNGKYSGQLYKAACISHSDVGQGHQRLVARLSHFVKAAFFNLSNKDLRIKAQMLVPKPINNPYETLKLHGYFAVFELGNNARIVLYANGAVVPNKDGDVDTLPIIEADLLQTLRSCEIVKVCPYIKYEA